MNKELTERLFYVLGIAAIAVMLFNTVQINALKDRGVNGGIGSVIGGAVSDVIPTGVPDIYGEELKLAYDDVSAANPQLADQTIRKLSVIDRQVTLTGAELDRYITILYKMENGMSCEYCCGARSIIFETGEPACGCAHSFAMRGLTKYLITEHGDEYTDAEILEEIGKWKTLFFPTQMSQKAQVLKEKGVEFNYINLASNKYRGIEKGSASSGGMVGGC